MSKKKGKSARSTAPSKPTRAAAPARKAAPRPAARQSTGSNGRTVYATIYIYRTSHGNKIRTSPQRLFANPGDRVSWTVVNLVDGSEVPVRLTWRDSSPWGKGPIEFRGSERLDLAADAKGSFKYTVWALDAQEDPELVIPDI
jgi:plastocyanin